MIKLKAKVWAKKIVRGSKEYKTLYIAIPSPIAEELGIKEGDVLKIIVKRIEVNGKEVNAVIYYKP